MKNGLFELYEAVCSKLNQLCDGSFHVIYVVYAGFVVMWRSVHLMFIGVAASQVKSNGSRFFCSFGDLYIASPRMTLASYLPQCQGSGCGVQDYMHIMWFIVVRALLLLTLAIK